MMMRTRDADRLIRFRVRSSSTGNVEDHENDDQDDDRKISNRGHSGGQFTHTQDDDNRSVQSFVRFHYRRPSGSRRTFQAHDDDGDTYDNNDNGIIDDLTVRTVPVKMPTKSQSRTSWKPRADEAWQTVEDRNETPLHQNLSHQSNTTPLEQIQRTTTTSQNGRDSPSSKTRQISTAMHNEHASHSKKVAMGPKSKSSYGGGQRLKGLPPLFVEDASQTTPSPSSTSSSSSSSSGSSTSKGSVPTTPPFVSPSFEDPSAPRMTPDKHKGSSHTKQPSQKKPSTKLAFFGMTDLSDLHSKFSLLMMGGNMACRGSLPEDLPMAVAEGVEQRATEFCIAVDSLAAKADQHAQGVYACGTSTMDAMAKEVSQQVQEVHLHAGGVMDTDMVDCSGRSTQGTSRDFFNVLEQQVAVTSQRVPLSTDELVLFLGDEFEQSACGVQPVALDNVLDFGSNNEKGVVDNYLKTGPCYSTELEAVEEVLDSLESGYEASLFHCGATPFVPQHEGKHTAKSHRK